MAIEKRDPTEEDVLHAEQAFSDFADAGHTERKCPWCGGELEFHDGGSGFLVECKNCVFRVSFRGV